MLKALASLERPPILSVGPAGGKSPGCFVFQKAPERFGTACPPVCWTRAATQNIKHQVELKPRAVKDLKSLPREEAKRVADRLKLLEDDLQGDVRRLTGHTVEYRMRAGNWRALFEIGGSTIIVYRILH